MRTAKREARRRQRFHGIGKTPFPIIGLACRHSTSPRATLDSPPGAAVEGLIREYSLSSQEGVALMCLAEALLRIPDAATRDALIATRSAAANGAPISATAPSPFVNAATWGLLITGRLVGTSRRGGLVGGADAPDRALGRADHPRRRRHRDAGAGRAIRLRPDDRGGARQREAARRAAFRYSYDMLGEAATDRRGRRALSRILRDALDAIGAPPPGAASMRGRAFGQALGAASALHARPARARDERTLCRASKASRCARAATTSASTSTPRRPSGSTSRSICWRRFAAIRTSPGWNGVGFVVQAYQKRAPIVIDWIIDLARATKRRIMLRLVKGAYWDSEIKRAQVDGLEGFPVFTRKIHTDVSYLACAKLLLRRRTPSSAIRHPQRADARDDPRDGGRQLLRRPV
jgi:RHH-type proline utilization regulon transcriptional repressor/proline dehydrogenase/delta 1-pyrroline-5-carboxylate dehydrogenase